MILAHRPLFRSYLNYGFTLITETCLYHSILILYIMQHAFFNAASLSFPQPLMPEVLLLSTFFFVSFWNYLRYRSWSSVFIKSHISKIAGTSMNNLASP